VEAPRIVQLALCSTDLPSTVRRYTKVFGLADAGGHVLGPWLARNQGPGDDTATTLWWIVGRQDLVQLELFSHTEPAIGPLPPGHSAADHGAYLPNVRFVTVASAASCSGRDRTKGA
jgi:hypothetical protein